MAKEVKTSPTADGKTPSFDQVFCACFIERFCLQKAEINA
jgi:hypothetical protein